MNPVPATATTSFPGGSSPIGAACSAGSISLVGPKARLLSGSSVGKPAGLGLAVELRARREVDFRGWVEPDYVAGLAERRRAVLRLEGLRIGGIGWGQQRERYASGENELPEHRHLLPPDLREGSAAGIEGQRWARYLRGRRFRTGRA